MNTLFLRKVLKPQKVQHRETGRHWTMRLFTKRRLAASTVLALTKKSCHVDKLVVNFLGETRPSTSFALALSWACSLPDSLSSSCASSSADDLLIFLLPVCRCPPDSDVIKYTMIHIYPYICQCIRTRICMSAYIYICLPPGRQFGYKLLV